MKTAVIIWQKPEYKKIRQGEGRCVSVADIGSCPK